MALFNRLVTVLAVAALVTGSPLRRVPELAIVNGVPFIYAVDDNVNPNKVTPKVATISPNLMEDEVNSNYDVRPQNLPIDEQKRSALRFAIARRSNEIKDADKEKSGKLDKYIPALSIGAMMNLRDFFDGLKGNLNMLESKGVSPEEFRALHSLSGPVESHRSVSQYVEDSHIRPTANAAYLHAIRMYRPSHQVRALVAHHPEPFRGANNFNPSYLWTGLG